MFWSLTMATCCFAICAMATFNGKNAFLIFLNRKKFIFEIFDITIKLSMLFCTPQKKSGNQTSRLSFLSFFSPLKFPAWRDVLAPFARFTQILNFMGDFYVTREDAFSHATFVAIRCSTLLPWQLFCGNLEKLCFWALLEFFCGYLSADACRRYSFTLYITSVPLAILWQPVAMVLLVGKMQTFAVFVCNQLCTSSWSFPTSLISWHRWTAKSKQSIGTPTYFTFKKF